MASAKMGDELECSVCLNIYTDPVMLRCGHNFCQVCIDRVLNTQGGSKGYSCPECRGKFQERPAPQRNMKLRNIVETFLSAQPDLEESGVFCTYCVDSPVPAVKSCLLCEASLCDKHLKVHSKSKDHILCDPIANPQNRKCPIHKEVFKYYCTEDCACICMSCCLIGGHKGHQMESLDEASVKRKENLKKVLHELLTVREETQERVQSLQEHRGNVHKEAARETQRATDLFKELQRCLEDLEKKVLSEISGQAQQVLLSVDDLIQKQKIKKDELSRKISHIEELCNMTDPLTVLQEPDTGDLYDTEDGDNKDRKRHDKLLHDGGDLDVFQISHTLHTGLSEIRTWVNKGIYIPEPADILLDVNTASNKLQISEDRKTASCSPNQSRPIIPGRFQDHPQVISRQSFSAGRHYWDVDVGRSRNWRVGVCYPSIERSGDQSRVGENNKSWGLGERSGLYLLLRPNHKRHVRNLTIHDSKCTQLPTDMSSDRVRIYLDYDAGQISFYDLCDPICHLHSFTATFIEPLHAALWVDQGHLKIYRGDHEM